MAKRKKTEPAVKGKAAAKSGKIASAKKAPSKSGRAVSSGKAAASGKGKNTAASREAAPGGRTGSRKSQVAGKAEGPVYSRARLAGSSKPATKSTGAAQPKAAKPTRRRSAKKEAAAKNRERTSSTAKASRQDTFSEKLNTVTPSSYKDQTFFEQVFEVARQIPRGRVTSYGAIAACLGAKSSSRMVGWAMNLAGSAKPKVPAHRVVNRMGMLSGKHHFATPTLMQELLEKEGVKVKNDKVVEFSKLFWDPMDLDD